MDPREAFQECQQVAQTADVQALIQRALNTPKLLASLDDSCTMLALIEELAKEDQDYALASAALHGRVELRK